MNILSKFLYYFQCFPIFLPKTFFSSLNQTISHFIWGRKHPRISQALLRQNKEMGGLALPGFIHYYWAANLQKILPWLHAPEFSLCSLEAQACRSTSLPALVFSSLPMKPSCYTLNPVVLSTLFMDFKFYFKYGSIFKITTNLK